MADSSVRETILRDLEKLGYTGEEAERVIEAARIPARVKIVDLVLGYQAMGAPVEANP